MSESIDEFYDQRRHRRVPASGTARVNFGGQWHSCPLIDLSGGGASFEAKIRPLMGANILVQLRGVGIVRAKVVARSGNDFAVEFNQADFDAGTFVDNLMFQANATLLEKHPIFAGPESGSTQKSAEPTPLEPAQGRDNQDGAEQAENAQSDEDKPRKGLRLGRLIGR
ncbi:MAG: PilZ domain-containing protein [Pseudomonadota bacterium]